MSRTAVFALPSKVNLNTLARRARPRLAAKIRKLAAGADVAFTVAEASDLRVLAATK